MAKPSEELFARRATGLVREFGAFAVFAIVMCYTIGVSINFIVINTPPRFPGADMGIAFLISGFIMIFTSLANYLQSCAMPRSGGPYVQISRVFNPAFGYVCGLAYFLYMCRAVGVVCLWGSKMTSSAFSVLGSIFNDPGMLAIATTLNIDTIASYIGSAWIIVCGLILMFYRKLGRWLLYVMFVWPFIAGGATMLYLFSSNVANTPAIWNSAFGAGAYKEIIDTAIQAGWKPELAQFNWDQTLAAVPTALTAWTGVAIIGTYVAGEAKRPTRSMFIGTVVAAILTLLFQIGYWYGLMHAFSYEFVQQLNFAVRLPMTINPALAPSVPLAAGVLAHGSWPMALLLTTAGTFFTYNVGPAGLIALSRAGFALSFDRMLPERLSWVNERTGTPIWNYAVMMGLSIFFCVVTPYWGLWTSQALGWFNASIMLSFSSFSAAILPFLRRDIYELAGKPVTWTILGIPLITIAGLIGFIGWITSLLISAHASATGALGMTGLLIPVLQFAIMVLVFFYYYVKNWKMGIDVTLTYKEIPPE